MRLSPREAERERVGRGRLGLPPTPEVDRRHAADRAICGTSQPVQAPAPPSRNLSLSRHARGRGALALGLLLLAACTPKAETPTPVTLDCGQTFEAMKAKVVAQPGIVAAPTEPNEPYRAYSIPGGGTSYFVTEPGAPAYPAILMQRASAGQMTNTGCAYGDKTAYAELMDYLTGLKAGRK